jgi:hypothetical protein
MRDHILGQEWTCRVFEEGAVTRQSALDLTKMDASGNVNGGSETFIDGTTRKVDAKVTSVGLHMQLTVTAENNDVYKGILVLQVMGDTFMAIAGKLHVYTDPVGPERRAEDVDDAERLAAFFDQDDPPVVITKP